MTKQTNIPLVDQALSDPRFLRQARGIDQAWKYSGIIPISVSGFNPFLSTFFYPARSAISDWLNAPDGSIRARNEGDLLMKELLFFAHDYLHAWAYRAIAALVPRLGFGVKPITRENFEDYVFCHLLTEAVATVGLDYWFLSTVDLNQICDAGTAVRVLTVPYRQENEREYKKFNPRLDVQSPKFFELIARFNCDGVFPGFELDDVKRSPLTLSWLKHELQYGEKQRQYARSWLSYLSTDCSLSESNRPVDTTAPWKKELIRELGLLLWDKVKNGRDTPIAPRLDPREVFDSQKKRALDFRFLNLNHFDPQESARQILRGRNADRGFKYFFFQYVSQFDYASFDKMLIRLFPYLIEKKDFELIEHLFRKQKAYNPIAGEPGSLFILN